MTTIAIMLPTSRGHVGVSSTDPRDFPIIDNNYYATEHDQFVMRSGMKIIGKMLKETNEG
jgi:choline dehydrogenase-like flavoprotein